MCIYEIVVVVLKLIPHHFKPVNPSLYVLFQLTFANVPSLPRMPTKTLMLSSLNLFNASHPNRLAHMLGSFTVSLIIEHMSVFVHTSHKPSQAIVMNASVSADKVLLITSGSDKTPPDSVQSQSPNARVTAKPASPTRISPFSSVCIFTFSEEFLTRSNSFAFVNAQWSSLRAVDHVVSLDSISSFPVG